MPRRAGGDVASFFESYTRETALASCFSVHYSTQPHVNSRNGPTCQCDRLIPRAVPGNTENFPPKKYTSCTAASLTWASSFELDHFTHTIKAFPNPQSKNRR